MMKRRIGDSGSCRQERAHVLDGTSSDAQQQSLTASSTGRSLFRSWRAARSNTVPRNFEPFPITPVIWLVLCDSSGYAAHVSLVLGFRTPTRARLQADTPRAVPLPAGSPTAIRCASSMFNRWCDRIHLVAMSRSFRLIASKISRCSSITTLAMLSFAQASWYGLKTSSIRMLS